MKINTNCLNGKKVGLAVSGGADSIALLLTLHDLSENLNLNLTVRHFEHGIRGEESLEDASFVESLCNKLGVTFVLGKGDIPRFSKENGLSMEEAARIKRYEFLTAGDEDVIATAHNLNDNAETFIFNLIRGTKLAGLCGIEPETVINGKRIVRPLLAVTREEIETYLREKNQEYRTDSTNSNVDYSRNKLRHIVFPALKEINSKTFEHIYSVTKYLTEIKELRDSIVEAVIRDNTENNKLNINIINKVEPFIKKEIIHKWLCENTHNGKNIGEKHIEAVLELVTSSVGKSINLPGVTVKRGYEDICICNNESIKTNKIKCLFNIYPKEKDTQILRENYTKQFDYDKILCGFSLRMAEKGDYFTINKNLDKKSFNRFCIDEKIPAEIRGEIPLLADGNHIMWAIGYRISEAYKITDSTKTILEVTVKEK